MEELIETALVVACDRGLDMVVARRRLNSALAVNTKIGELTAVSDRYNAASMACQVAFNLLQQRIINEAEKVAAATEKRQGIGMGG